MLEVLDSLSSAHGKLMAISETGLETIPNEKWFTDVVLPVLNFQFNVVIDEEFISESRKLLVLSYFRGGMSVISLVLLLFVGRIYGRWGLPTALMIHPVN